jgi:hypothetical protein
MKTLIILGTSGFIGAIIGGILGLLPAIIVFVIQYFLTKKAVRAVLNEERTK